MALRGKKPEAVTKRLKMLVYGKSGIGKTTAAIQFPSPYLIDTERGAENESYAGHLKKSGGVIFQTVDFEEMVTEVRSLLSEQHKYRTLIIDPMTTVFNDLLDVGEREVGTDFGRHYGFANKRMKHLCNLLLRLDMNVIVTSHSKTEYGENLVKLGETFDGYKKLDYLFDLVIEAERRGRDRVGVVRKTRLDSFVQDDTFPFGYEAIAEKYGRGELERDSTPQALATAEQSKELADLIKLAGVDETAVGKWLDKAKAATLPELPADSATKCIEYCKKQIKNQEATS